MSVELVEMGRRLRAAEARKAMRRTDVSHVAVHRDAVLLAVLQLPGTAAELWGVAVAALDGSQAKVFVADDPWGWQSQLEVFRFLHTALEPVAAAAADGKHAPQFFVASDDAWELMSTAALRALAMPDDEPGRAAGELLVWADERAGLPGSCVVVRAAQTLARHFVTGGSEADEASLSWMLAWLNDDTEGLDQRLNNIDDVDDTVLPLSVERADQHTALNASDRADPARIAARAVLAEAVLRGRIGRLADAVAELRKLPGRPHAGVADIAAFDKESFNHHRGRLHNGYLRRQRRGMATSLSAFAEAEEVAGLWESAVLWHDPAAAIDAVVDGRALTGTVSHEDGLVQVRSEQPELRCRVGDRFAAFGTPRITHTVVRLQRDDDGTTTVTLKATKPVDYPVEALFFPPPITADQVTKRVSSVRAAAKRPAWTHDRKAAPKPGGRPVPADPLAAAVSHRSF